jgi:hypothetical protein
MKGGLGRKCRGFRPVEMIPRAHVERSGKRGDAPARVVMADLSYVKDILFVTYAVHRSL